MGETRHALQDLDMIKRAHLVGMLEKCEKEEEARASFVGT